jgi:hypothetical protein
MNFSQVYDEVHVGKADAATDLEISYLERLWRDGGQQHIEHHPTWARTNAQATGVRLHTFTTCSNTGIDSYSLVREERGALSWMIGEVRIYRRAIERMHVIGGQVFAPSLDPIGQQDRARELLAWLAKMTGDRPVFLQSIPVDSPLMTAVRSGNHPFWVIPHGARQPHFAIDLPNSLSAFYEGLGYKTRKSVRYSIRKFENHFGENISLRVFAAPHEVDSFLRDAMTISRATYQYRLLEAGLRNYSKLLAEFGMMSKLGCWRGYILYCREDPVAFVYGYRLASTFYYWDVGYRPNWGQWSVGTVTALKLIENLIDSEDPPRRLDFLYGGHDYKRRLSNLCWSEETAYLFPKTAANFLTSHSLQLTNFVSERAGRILEHYDLKSRVKRYFRRRSIGG